MIQYVRINRGRGVQFQTVTTIEPFNGRLYAVKKPLTPQATDHVLKQVENYKLLAASKPPFKLLEVTQVGNTARMPFLEGAQTLDAQFRHLMAIGDRAAAYELLDTMLAYIRRLPTTNRPADQSAYQLVFGPTFPTSKKFLTFGYIDYNLDNVMRHQKDLYLLDYEWVFDFSIPQDLALTRLLLNAFSGIRNLLMTSASKQSPVMLVSQQYAVPQDAYERYRPIFDLAPQANLAEQYFQYYVGTASKPQGPPPPHTSQRLTQPEASTVLNMQAALNHQLELVNKALVRAQNENAAMHQIIADTSHKYADSHARLQEILGSRSYKIAQKIAKTHNIFFK